ncbi:GH3 family domain-containing protein [Consotaella aegiceratis]|uniref:GH3 family domain-containing protein n=1 Tax=Consotaella aegiceratis TaxID=3097961 RepID=UPI002F422131
MASNQLNTLIAMASEQVRHLARAQPPSEDVVLCAYLRSREGARIGRDFAFASLLAAPSAAARYEAFRKLPITDYTFYAPYIAAIEAGESDVLGPGQPSALTLSGGSTNPGKQKLVPLYSDLRITHAGAAYVAALVFGKIDEGQTYLNLVRPTPVERLPTTAAGHPIAMASTFVESACSAAPWFSDTLERVPFALKCASAGVGAQYWHAILPHALSQQRLRYIFAIYPNVVISFLSCLEESIEGLVAALPDPRKQIDAAAPPLTPTRLAELQAICATAQPFREKLARIWPDLDFAICVVTGGYSQYQKVLRDRYGLEAHTLSYGASEAALGFNFFDADRRFVPNPSTFFEALHCGEDVSGSTDIVPLSRMMEGETYELIVTSPQSGFFRYRIGDVVRICRGAGQPRFEVIGRAQAVLSVAHEMTQEHHIRSVLDAVRHHADYPELKDGPCFVAHDPDALRYVYAFETETLDMVRPRVMGLQQILDQQMRAANDLYQHYRVRGLIDLPEVLLVPLGSHHRAFQDQIQARGADQNQTKPNIVISQQTLEYLRAQLEAAPHGSENPKSVP